MKIVVVKDNQQLRDIALEQYGSNLGLFWLCQDNAVAANHLPSTGDLLKIRNEVINKNRLQYFSENDYKVASMPI